MSNYLRYFCTIIIVFILGAVQAQADTLGQNEHFFIASQYAVPGQTNIAATLRQVSTHAYFYIGDNYWDTLPASDQNELLGKLTSIGNEFDNHIYPVETAAFGSEPNPGIDGDNHITILLTPLASGIGGFFDSTNENSRTVEPLSNQREMISINPGIQTTKSLRDLYALIAHEFQHLITVEQKDVLQHSTDQTWTNELRSEYAITLLGYNDPYDGSNLQRRVNNFLHLPTFDLEAWTNSEADYDEINLFAEYVAEHWSPKIITDTIYVSVGGRSSIDAALARNNYLNSFDDLAKYWQIATVLNDCPTNVRFCYTKPELATIHVGNSASIANLLAWAGSQPAISPTPIITPQITPTVSPTPVRLPQPTDGSLVRATGSTAVYLLGDHYRRHIINPAVFPIYGWSFANVHEISAAELAQYQESRLLRSTTTDRVYEIDTRGRRHWLHMSEATFRASGRPADSIFNVNPRELNFYKLALEVRK